MRKKSFHMIETRTDAHISLLYLHNKSSTTLRNMKMDQKRSNIMIGYVTTKGWLRPATPTFVG